jgi:hypothetical protein
LTAATVTTTAWAATFTEGIGSVQSAVVSLIGQLERLAAIPLPSVPGVSGVSVGGPGFATGSNGLRDFGSGTVVTLHGREEVRTERQVNADTALIDELRGMRADNRRQAAQMAATVRAAVLTAV